MGWGARRQLSRMTLPDRRATRGVWGCLGRRGTEAFPKMLGRHLGRTVEESHPSRGSWAGWTLMFLPFLKFNGSVVWELFRRWV